RIMSDAFTARSWAPPLSIKENEAATQSFSTRCLCGANPHKRKAGDKEGRK
ncbi:MAG: hypothetical protein ACI8PT_004214, partial [Gammaproteobacteria bacterium]